MVQQKGTPNGSQTLRHADGIVLKQRPHALMQGPRPLVPSWPLLALLEGPVEGLMSGPMEDPMGVPMEGRPYGGPYDGPYGGLHGGPY